MTLACLFAAREMTPAAWIFLLATWGAIVVLNVYCIAKVLTSGKK